MLIHLSASYICTMKNNSRRNRNAGHSYEREKCKDFNIAGFTHVVTSRSESRSRDNQKVDLINKNERVNGQLPYNVQCKNCSSKLNYNELLNELPNESGIINVVFHKETKKSGTRFIKKAEYAILHQKDFMRIIQDLEFYKSLSKIK